MVLKSRKVRKTNSVPILNCSTSLIIFTTNLLHKYKFPVRIVYEHGGNKNHLRKSALLPQDCRRQTQVVQEQRTRGSCNTCSIDPMNHPCLKNDVVYQLQCKECCEQYIGETARSLESRLTEHSADARLTRQSTSWGCHFANKHPSCKVTSAATVFPKQIYHCGKRLGLLQAARGNQNM